MSLLWELNGRLYEVSITIVGTKQMIKVLLPHHVKKNKMNRHYHKISIFLPAFVSGITFAPDTVLELSWANYRID